MDFRTEYFNPTTPVNIPVQGFSAGSRLRLVIVPNNDPGFHINLRTPDDIALHFSPNFDDGSVKVNSTSGGEWQSEESRLRLPFEQNKMYTVEFVSNEGSISVFVNGNHLADFTERTPLEAVHLIEIDGGVQVNSVHISH
ncbi:unnamed protein product [Caenorhabditis sp. 36 PRJEB53466]|nr:unnamed protein product [Caenorhabditis sp. 36 PRJEB53466]